MAKTEQTKAEQIQEKRPAEGAAVEPVKKAATEAVYPASELAEGAAAFGVSKVLAAAALRGKGGKEYTRAQAQKIIDEYKGRSVKPNGRRI